MQPGLSSEINKAIKEFNENIGKTQTFNYYKNAIENHKKLLIHISQSKNFNFSQVEATEISTVCTQMTALIQYFWISLEDKSENEEAINAWKNEHFTILKTLAEFLQNLKNNSQQKIIDLINELAPKKIVPTQQSIQTTSQKNSSANTNSSSSPMQIENKEETQTKKMSFDEVIKKFTTVQTDDPWFQHIIQNALLAKETYCAEGFEFNLMVLAIITGNTELRSSVLKRQLNLFIEIAIPNQTSSRYTGFNLASLCVELNRCNTLFDILRHIPTPELRKVFVNQRNSSGKFVGYPPVLVAAHRGNYKMVQLLLDAGAEPNADILIQAVPTPLRYTCITIVISQYENLQTRRFKNPAEKETSLGIFRQIFTLLLTHAQLNGLTPLSTCFNFKGCYSHCH